MLLQISRKKENNFLSLFHITGIEQILLDYKIYLLS